MSKISEIRVYKHGIIGVHVQDKRGNYIATITPGSCLSSELDKINNSLAEMGISSLQPSEWGQVVDTCAMEWSDDVITSYMAVVRGDTDQKYSKTDYANAVEARFDREAQKLGYDNLAKATTYVASGNSRFAAEAGYFIALRDACWSLCFDALAKPPAIPPTPAEFAESIVTQALARIVKPTYS